MTSFEKSTDMQSINMHESVELKTKFYLELLNKAFEDLDGLSAPVMVCGPLFINGNFHNDRDKLQEYQGALRSSKIDVFDQIPYLDVNQENAPMDYDLKFELFYKGLIMSGKIKKCYFIPGWEQSQGARSEHDYCVSAGVQIEYIK